jgi:hypothetical protein
MLVCFPLVLPLMSSASSSMDARRRGEEKAHASYPFAVKATLVGDLLWGSNPCEPLRSSSSHLSTPQPAFKVASDRVARVIGIGRGPLTS